MQVVRSHSRAVFLVGAGYRPVDIDWRGPKPTYWFTDDIAHALTKYVEADRIVNALADESRMKQIGGER